MHDLNETVRRLSRVDLNLLVVLDAIAQTGSVTLCAERLSLSQPAVSHALKRLRDLTNDPLFVRGRSGLLPTPRAEALLPAVRSALGTVASALAEPSFDPATTDRRFRIAASDYSMMTVLPAVVAQIRTLASGATVEVRHGGPEALTAMERGELDIAFWGDETPGGPFQNKELFRERYVGLVCARHPLADKVRREKLTVDDYAAWPHVIATLRDARLSPVDKALKVLGVSRKFGMISPNFLANMASLPGTDLIMSVPSRLVRVADQEALTVFPLPFDLPDYPYSIVWHSRALADPAHQWLRDAVFTAAGRGSLTPVVA